MGQEQDFEIVKDAENVLPDALARIPYRACGAPLGMPPRRRKRIDGSEPYLPITMSNSPARPTS